ncbi:M56 family metallopeptidase [Psychroserpens burtonensis]|uniref:M56 family metallopeptidase n=1 Tax=Psychroserpens burtonensis TaxID=49278 RepID=A0A5C7B9P4_9FLAO|nr:M56 family metallopeptidase [Psychroserpens burtonensis]
MLIYLLKFSACLAIFMVFYKLLFEKSSVHKFKRFYLLATLVLALVIPSLTFIEYIEPVIDKEHNSFVVSDSDMVETIPEVIEVNYTPIILWSLYGLGIFVFLLKFCINLNTIISRIKNNPKLKTGSFIHVLVSNLKTPHTFFNYIFFNKHKFEQNDIPKEVLIHEQTHAKQKHSIDVLLLELLQIIFWFNPLIYLLKRDVKLNHEFLADRAVLQNGIEPSTYQTILLAFSSKAEHQELANAINYSSIKKRFTVMNTHTSKRSIWLRSLLILPVLALLFYGFTESEQLEIEIIPPEIIELYLNEDGELLLENKIITYEDIEELYRPDLKLQVTIKVFQDADVKIAKDVSKKLKEIGIKKMTVCTSRISEFQNDSQEEATPKQVAEYNILAKKINAQSKNNPIIKLKDIERINYLYKLMSTTQKESAQPFPNFPPQPPAPTPPVKVIKNEITWILLNSKGQFSVNDKSGSLKSVEAKFKSVWNDKNKSKNIVFRHENNSPSDMVNKVNTLIDLYNLDNISDTLPPPPPGNQTQQNQPTGKEVTAYNAYAKAIKQQTIDIGQGKLIPPVSEKDLVNFTNIYKRMTDKQRNNAESFPDALPPPIPEDATQEQRAKMKSAINDFEKTYKRKVHQAKTDNDEMISVIVNDDVYEQTQDKNKVKTGFQKINGTLHYYVSINAAIKYYNRQGFEVNKTGVKISKRQVNASDVLPGQYITKVYSDSKVVSEFKDNEPNTYKDKIDIPSPPRPISRLDHIIAMAKKDATFFYEGQKVSSDSAIQLVKKHDELNLFTKDLATNKPRVFLTKDTTIPADTEILPKSNK